MSFLSNDLNLSEVVTKVILFSNYQGTGMSFEDKNLLINKYFTNFEEFVNNAIYQAFNQLHCYKPNN